MAPNGSSKSAIADAPAGEGPRATPRPGKTLPSFLVLGYFVLILLTCAALRSPGIVANGNETTWDRAIFTAVNAATLTGFQQTMGIREMSATSFAGPMLLLFLTFAGSLLSLIVGGLAATRILGMPHTMQQVVLAALTSMLLATVGGAAALTVGGHTVFEAIFQAACAFGNSGLWFGQAPSISAGSTFLVLLPLAVLGGLGLPVLLELSDRLFGGPPLSRHSRVVLKLAGFAYLFGFVALLVAQAPVALGNGWPAWRNTIASCSVQAINTRTAGIPFQSPAAFSAPGQWILMALMLLGAASAGTAGGLKTTTIRQLVRGAGDALRGGTTHRATGIASVWLAAYVLTMFLGVLLLAGIEPQFPADRLLFLVISAIGNVGLSHDPVSITGPGLLVLSALMLAGRMGPLAILWWMARDARTADVAVG